MDKILTYIATSADEGQTLGTVLRSGLGLTARQIKQVKFLPDGLFINDERFRDGRLITTRTAVRKNDHIRVKFQEKSETVVPFAGDLEIVYEDEDIVFINKPAVCGEPVKRGFGICNLVVICTESNLINEFASMSAAFSFGNCACKMNGYRGSGVFAA